ncbi:hypothetical protein [Blastomonas sp. AAP25]|uniref:hypothetical protein n=1 Tax=Blastomonas sp. AAP25 TaxID=1523416 RepID=UPI0006B9682D|nr:hypothetical protein [Blastomonas sp. AAP25]
MANPFYITGPALISFSGGRTSAYMLWRILQAHGGTLPDDVHVCFANTGKERAETLRFVHECGSRWGVHVHWLEWQDRRRKTPAVLRYAEVGFNSASRKGEPFKALIKSKSAVPNAYQRWCTTHLKFQVCCDFMEVKGHPTWKNVIGLRADEMHRVFKKLSENHEQDNCWTNMMPLADGLVRKADVLRFWLGSNIDPLNLTEPLPQGFDLCLPLWDGNCIMCMMKARKVLEHICRTDPDEARDWAEMERIGGGTFTTEYSINDLRHAVQRSPQLPLEGDFDEHDAECGAHCGEAA